MISMRSNTFDAIIYLANIKKITGAEERKRKEKENIRGKQSRYTNNTMHIKIAMKGEQEQALKNKAEDDLICGRVGYLA